MIEEIRNYPVDDDVNVYIFVAHTTGATAEETEMMFENADIVTACASKAIDEYADEHKPYGSYGNGSAMRVSSVGWLFNDIGTVMEEAKRSAEVSHNHEEGIRGAVCTATLIYWLRTVRITKDEVEHSIRRKFGYEIPSLKDVMRIGSLGHFDGTCQETVPAAIRCFLDSESFEDAIRKAVLADGDTDTKGAITGSIAEAYYEIPDEIIDKALSYLPKDMLDIVTQFCDTVIKVIDD